MGWLELPASTADSNQFLDTFKAGSQRNYTYLYDKSKYTMLWAAYPVYKGAIGSLSRPDWEPNPNLSESAQINIWDGSYGVDYGSTIYARGHMIPNGSRNGNSTMQQQTFYATNSVPQIQDNFNGGIWSELENSLRGELSSTSDTLYVVTGAVFNKVGGSETITYIQPQHDSKKCPVANYFYKVVLKVKWSGTTVYSASAVGFWFEHKQYSGNDFSAYAVSVDQIEAWTGMDFFVNLPDTIENSAEQNSSWTSF